MTVSKTVLPLLIMALGMNCAYAKKQSLYQQGLQLKPEQSAVVDKAVAREKILIKDIQERTPLVETYIQNTKPDVNLYQVPVQDEYMLSRVDFGKGFFNKSYDPRTTSKRSLFKNSVASISGLAKALGLDRNFSYNAVGFTDMMFLDPSNFDSQHYAFVYVRREFLGSVRTWVFDVHPKVSGTGRFYGRLWIEDHDDNIVRFNGTFTHPKMEDPSKFFFHFDSWRLNVQPGIWLPVEVYVEETERNEDQKSVGLKAQTRFWGYSLKLPTRDTESITLKVDDAVDKSNDGGDVGPLQATQAWITQAEGNVIDRLVLAGLVAPLAPGGYENTVLDQIVTNLAVPNNLAFTDPVHCRILLSTTIEATTVGNTILISKGLIDTMPNEEVIASVISMELAHIVMGHHIDTRYAFNDRLLFPDETTFQRIDMYHSDHDNNDAAKRAMEYLNASMYKEKLPNAGLFWNQLADRGKVLKALNTPKLGDSMLKSDGTPWMAELAHSAPKLNWDDMTQTAALPLGSWIKTDPWDDKVQMLNAKRYAPMNARDKMPLEVTPIFFNLQRYQALKLDSAPASSSAAQSSPHTDNPAQPVPVPPETTPLPKGDAIDNQHSPDTTLPSH